MSSTIALCAAGKKTSCHIYWCRYRHYCILLVLISPETVHLPQYKMHGSFNAQCSQIELRSCTIRELWMRPKHTLCVCWQRQAQIVNVPWVLWHHCLLVVLALYGRTRLLCDTYIILGGVDYTDLRTTRQLQDITGFTTTDWKSADR